MDVNGKSALGEIRKYVKIAVTHLTECISLTQKKRDLCSCYVSIRAYSLVVMLLM